MSSVTGGFVRGDLSRRDFVALLGASMALAGATGCVREPSERILPYLDTPPDVLPGVSRRYATAMTLDGYATGLLVDSRDGRPIKIEGNPDHPASRGAAGIFEQASLLQLYDPHRAHGCRLAGRSRGWSALAAALAPAALSPQVGARGAGLHLLLEPTSSPELAALLDRVRQRYPAMGVTFYAPFEQHAALDASNDLYGVPVLPQHDLTAARAVVSLGADLLAEGPWHLRDARDFSGRPRHARAALYVAETAPSPTGTLARRIAVSPELLVSVAAALLAKVSSETQPDGGISPAPALPADAEAWVTEAARALLAHRGESVIAAGPTQPAAIHRVALALNAMLDNVGRTIWYITSPIIEAGAPSHDIAPLAAALSGGAVDTLLIGGVNPVYSAPGDVSFDLYIRRARTLVYLGDYADETARVAHWFAARAHYLESWGDARACDGTVSAVQPLIAPMFAGHTTAELLALLLGEARRGKALLQLLQPASASDAMLRRGVIDGSAFTRQTPPFHRERMTPVPIPAPAAGAITVAVTPGRGVHDGRFAQNAWLQELPDPVSKLTWDNAALISPGTAAAWHVVTGDVVRLGVRQRTIDIPVVVIPGHADAAASIALGYGRRGIGILDHPVGVDVGPLRSRAAPFIVAGVSAIRTGAHRELAVTQAHWSLAGRAEEIIGTPAATAAEPAVLYHAPAHGLEGFGADQWAMSIDLELCTGCSACVVACQAENNIPVVGRAGVLQRREMHWIRIDRYAGAAGSQASITNQPMLCQHCENAPCEYVCPVNATVHSDDGLNEMIYNRCVGTRFCSNNCPYKVRRFNWLNYHEDESPVDELLYNPDVTVRARGVMEKCTFCVQRLRGAQRDAELAGAPRTGPVMTACQQACPTQAIVFGSLTDAESAVTAAFRNPRSFAALASLHTVPRVRYLARDPEHDG